MIRVIYCYCPVDFNFSLRYPIRLNVIRIFRYTTDLITEYPSFVRYCLAYFHGLVYRLCYFHLPAPPQVGLSEIAISVVIR